VCVFIYVIGVLVLVFIFKHATASPMLQAVLMFKLS
jgi:hypothetical protein